MSLFRSIATVSGFTMASRVTGLAREMMIAHYMGASWIADAFFVAFRFPNLFRSLFAEGAFNAAFVPLFTGKLAAEGPAAAQAFAQKALAVMALVLAIFVGIMELAMPWAIYGLAPGFDAVPGKIELAADLARICFPYLLFISLTALQAGVLNSLGRFAAAAGTPVLLNVVGMTGLWALTPVTATPGHALAWGTFAAGIAQFLWLAVAVRKAGMGLGPVLPRLTPEVRTLARRIVPGAVGAGVYQVNLLVNTIIASGVANGAVSYLNYADRINQLPLGVIGVAIGTALLPLLSRQIKEGRLQDALDSQNRALELGLVLTVPAAAALIAIGLPVVQVLFQRGAFGPAETTATAAALSAFAIGLPAFVLVKALVPAFFAREDTRTPVKVAGATMVVNIALNLALVGPLAHVGMALATALAAWFNALVLAVLLARQGLFTIDARLKRRAPRIVLAALIMAAPLAAAHHYLWPLADGALAAGGLLAVMVVAGITLFAASAQLLGAVRWAEVKGQMRRRP
ncbi:MAG: murein biosynthesis integral membrane protein MurJ [Alphaproteobacteria bacterium]|nr:murein biosynthesis integral membrane protein MurJ [Alphaproteobacteria bacterium]